MTDKIEILIKVVLLVLLFSCLLAMPYTYYQLVRFLGLLGFGVLAITNYKKENHIIAFVYVALALLFQPILKVNLGRDLWNLVDVVVGLALIVSFVLERKNKPV